MFLKYGISEKHLLKCAKVFLLSVLLKVGTREWLAQNYAYEKSPNSPFLNLLASRNFLNQRHVDPG